MPPTIRLILCLNTMFFLYIFFKPKSISEGYIHVNHMINPMAGLILKIRFMLEKGIRVYEMLPTNFKSDNVSKCNEYYLVF